MSGVLMAGRRGKKEQTKKFLEEACALIELGNLVESYRRNYATLYEPYICDSKLDPCKVQRRAIEAGRGTTNKDGALERLKLESRSQSSRRHGQTLEDFVAHSIGKSIDSMTRKSNMKSTSRYKLQNLQSKKDKDKKNMNGDKSSNAQKIHRSTANRKNGRKISDRKIRKQVLASNLDTVNCMQLYSLKERFRHDELSKVLTILFPEKHVSKRSLKTLKSFNSFSDTHILNQNFVKRDTHMLSKAFGLNETQSKKSAVQKPSLQLSLNLRVKPNSNTLNLRIKSRNETCKMNGSDLDTLSLRLPLQFTSSAGENVINKLSPNLRTGWSERSNPSAQTSNDEKCKTLEQQVPATPYAKTQAVYNMYDVALMEQPREVRGFRSNIYFKLDIGRQPKTAQRYKHSEDTSPLNSQPSVGTGSPGGASMQESTNDLESDGYSQSCRCRNVSVVSDPGVYFDTQRSGSVCDPCCQGGLRARPQGQRIEETPLPDDLMERYALLYHRTKQRIRNRVGISGEDARSMVFAPRVFMKKLYDKYKNIASKVEEQQKSVGSCTCSPFIETEHVSVQEENINPECSFLKKCFGQLIFNNKCVICKVNKRIGTERLKSYECKPGECVVKSLGIFSCLKKLCKRKELSPEEIKAKKEREKEKLKLKKECERLKAKRRKEKEREDRLRFLKKCGTGFLTSIFKKPDEDDDRQRLLNDEDKKLTRGDVKEKEKGKGGKTDFEDKAKKTFASGRRGYRRITKRIRDRYYRNKKLAEEQKGRYACDFYLMSLRNKPCLWVYYLCPFFYPYCLQLLNAWRQVSDLLLFFVAIIVWSPCILCTEMLKVLACNMCVS